MATQSAIFKRANVLIKKGHDRKQAFAIAYDEAGKAAKKNPAPKRKTTARTQKAAVGYVNRPSQITKKSPTKRLKKRRTANLRSPKGVFPNPLDKRYVVQVWRANKMVGFLTMGGRVTTEFPDAWQFPTKKDADYHAKKYAAKSPSHLFKVDLVNLYYENPVAEKLGKRAKSLFELPEFPYRVESSLNGETWRSEGLFRTETIAREYARALDRKHGGRLWLKVTI